MLFLGLYHSFKGILPNGSSASKELVPPVLSKACRVNPRVNEGLLISPSSHEILYIIFRSHSLG